MNQFIGAWHLPPSGVTFSTHIYYTVYFYSISVLFERGKHSKKCHISTWGCVSDAHRQKNKDKKYTCSFTQHPLIYKRSCTIYTINVLSYLGKENCCSPCRSQKNIHLKYIFAQTFLSRHLPVRSALLLPPPSTSSSSWFSVCECTFSHTHWFVAWCCRQLLRVAEKNHLTTHTTLAQG